jgi:hypothetical protein
MTVRMAQVVTAGHLYVIVAEAVRQPGAPPIVTSSVVKRECDARGLVWDQPGSRSGGYLEQADRNVRRDGRLQRWKRGTGGNATVGWSLSAAKDPTSFALASAFAEQHGWRMDAKL